jgi:hypothetical protein
MVLVSMRYQHHERLCLNEFQAFLEGVLTEACPFSPEDLRCDLLVEDAAHVVLDFSNSVVRGPCRIGDRGAFIIEAFQVHGAAASWRFCIRSLVASIDATAVL